MTGKLKILLPLGVLIAGATTAVVLMIARPQAESRARTTPIPIVRAIQVRPSDVELKIRAHGTVVPEAEIDLVPEVAGRIVRIAPSLRNGVFFLRGEVLAAIDRRDYELAAQSAQAEVAGAEVRLAQESAEAEVAAREWNKLHGTEPAPPLVLRTPQLSEARAALAAARARLERARLDLQRTAITAPFDGRVREEHVDVGQFVKQGAVLGRIYSIEAAEVRLPLADRDLAYIDLPAPGSEAQAASQSMPVVRLSADFAGKRREWIGRIVRTEGEIDATTRMLHVVARVARPYEIKHGSDRVPLAFGMFVDAEIAGRRAAEVFEVPPIAMRGPSTVLVIDEEDRLRLRSVEVLRREAERVLLNSGLRSGERVCVSPLDIVADGMRVKIASASASAQPASKQR